jgi:S1-C subfamily serine protease
MRRLRALLVAGLIAAPLSAAATPPPERQPDEATSEASEPSDTSDTSQWSAGKPRLGITVMDLTPELRVHFGAPDHSGVLVAHVEPGSAAAKAKLRVGDVIVDVRGHSVDDAGDIRAALASVAKGKTASIKLVRDGTSRTIEVTLTSDARTRATDAS